jgi:hypothetical protein
VERSEEREKTGRKRGEEWRLERVGEGWKCGVSRAVRVFSKKLLR